MDSTSPRSGDRSVAGEKVRLRQVSLGLTTIYVWRSALPVESISRGLRRRSCVPTYRTGNGVVVIRNQYVSQLRCNIAASPKTLMMDGGEHDMSIQWEHNRKVSVIIPTYNRSELVVRAVSSVIQQDYPEKEIIVVDDGSTDDTRERLLKVPGISYYYQPNKGQAAARNLGLRHAQGEYIASLDSDDVWYGSFLAECVSALNRYNVDFVFSNWRVKGSQVNPLYGNGFASYKYLDGYRRLEVEGWNVLDQSQTRHLFVRHSPAPSSATVLRRGVIVNGWRNGTKISDDWLVLLEAIIYRQAKAAFTQKPLFTKWIHGGNICDENPNALKVAQAEIHDKKIVLQVVGEALARAVVREIRRQIAKSYCDLAYHASKLGDCQLGLRAYAAAAMHGRSREAVAGCAKMLSRRLFGWINTTYRTSKVS